MSEASPGGALQIGGCATVWNTHSLEPWVPGTATLQHLYYSTFAVTGGPHLDVGAGDPVVTFASTAGDGVFDRFESRLEERTTSIVFTKAGLYRGQGVGYSYGVPSDAFSQGTAPYNWPLPTLHSFD